MTWTAVEDGLPEDGKRVLVAQINKIVMMGVLWIEKGTPGWHIFYTSKLKPAEQKVTHWMPLPDLPELEK